MQSKHALFLALFAGATALLVVLAGLLSLGLLEAAEPYLGVSEAKTNNLKDNASKVVVPTFTTKLEGTQVQIVELDNDGQIVDLIYVSELNDAVADFTLFATPQTNYAGKIYVQSMLDKDGSSLIVYPLEVATGKIGAATLNVTSNSASISPHQNRVAIINLAPTHNISAYDIATGDVLAAWTGQANERLNEVTNPAQAYTGTGVHWINNDCFEHTVWTDTKQDLRTFCIDNI